MHASCLAFSFHLFRFLFGRIARCSGFWVGGICLAKSETAQKDDRIFVQLLDSLYGTRGFALLHNAVATRRSIEDIVTCRMALPSTSIAYEI